MNDGHVAEPAAALVVPAGDAVAVRVLFRSGTDLDGYIPVIRKVGPPPDPLGVVAMFEKLGIPATTAMARRDNRTCKEAWAPDWAAALWLADPIGEEYRHEALRRAVQDLEFRGAVSAAYRLGGLPAVASFVMGLP